MIVTLSGITGTGKSFFKDAISKELNFKKGDMIEAGQTIGYVGEPTKYYSTEGSNVYFELQKDGKPVNPKEYLPEMPMNTLD